MSQKNARVRILSIDPTTHGFAFAVMEGSQELVDWGGKNIRPVTNNRCLLAVAAQIRFFTPTKIVLEDTEGSRRCRRVRQLITAIGALATKERIKTCLISRERVKATFGAEGVTKHKIALIIGQCLPELTDRLPRCRKPWMSEDDRANIFDAVALALSFFEKEKMLHTMPRSSRTYVKKRPVL